MSNYSQLDVRGINRINGSPVSWRDYISSAHKVREQIVAMVKYLNNVFLELDLGITVSAPKLDNTTNDHIASVFKNYLSLCMTDKPPVIMTEDSASVIKTTLGESLKSRDAGWVQPILNCIKPTKAGKTKDIQHHAVLFSFVNFIQTGVLTYPFIILTAKNEVEDQLKDEWKLTSTFYRYLTFERNDACKWENSNSEVSLDEFFMQLSDRNWMVRRTSGDTFPNYIQQAMDDADNGNHIVIFIDEADEGAGKDQLLDRVFRLKGVWDRIIGDKRGSVSLMNYSATLEIARNLHGNIKTIELGVGTEYLHLRDVPCIDFKGFSSKLGSYFRIGDTASPQTHPFSHLGAFIYYWHADELAGMKKEDQEERVQELAKDPQTAMQHIWFRENYVPSEIMKATLKLSSDVGVNLSRCEMPFSVISLRYIVKNDQTMELLGFLRKRMDGKALVIPFCGEEDVFCGTKINWISECGQVTKAVTQAYKIAGLTPFSIPILVLLTGTGRRATEFPDNYALIDLTGEFGTQTTSIQAEGRASGYKTNSIIIVTEENKKELERICIGEGRKPYSRHGMGGNTQEDCHLCVHSSNPHPVVQKLFAAIESGILNKESMLKTLRANKKLQGGRTIDKRCAQAGEPLRNICDILSEDVLQELEANYKQIAITEDGKPYFSAPIRLLRFGEKDTKGVGYDYDESSKRGYVGLRAEDRLSGSHLDKNSNSRATESGQLQIQLHYWYEKTLDRMFLKHVYLRLAVGGRIGTPVLPRKGSFYYNAATVEEQKNIDGIVESNKRRKR